MSRILDSIVLFLFLLIGQAQEVAGNQFFFDDYFPQDSLIFSSSSQVSDSLQFPLQVSVEAVAFFKNNEYTSPYATGYTLPGIRFRPLLYSQASFSNGSRIRISAGLHMLMLFGANRLPTTGWDTELAHWENYKYSSYSPLRVRPLLSIAYGLNKNMEITMGTFWSKSSYNFLAPLYNTELSLTKDPEMGVLFKTNWTHFSSDLWIDWYGFIFRGAKQQEAFTVGLSTQYDCLRSVRNKLWIQLQGIATHRGGELNPQGIDSLHAYTSLALGINYQHYFPNQWMVSGASYALCSQERISSEHRLGWGMYSSLTVQNKIFAAQLNYWLGRRFVSPFSSPFVSSYLQPFSPPQTQPMDRTCYLSFAPYIKFRKEYGFEFYFGGELWLHPLQNSYILSTSPLRISHMLGLMIRFTPSWIIF